MERGFILCILGIILISVSLTTALLGADYEKREGLCVDGDGDINLEGIKCMKTYETFYGERLDHSFLFFCLVVMVGTGLLLVTFAP